MKKKPNPSFSEQNGEVCAMHLQHVEKSFLSYLDLGEQLRYYLELGIGNELLISTSESEDNICRRFETLPQFVAFFFFFLDSTYLKRNNNDYENST